MQYIATMQYMDAELIAQTKELRDDGTIVEIVIWKLPSPLPPSAHNFKYRLFFGAPGVCHIRYDNERGKGDHRHAGDEEHPYRFSTLENLLSDFENDVTRWSKP